MHFIPVLSRHNDLHPILLPLPTRSETFPNQIPWPWGNASRNIACLECMQVSEYSAESCQWRHVDSTDQLQDSKKMAIYQLSVPCGVKSCGGLIDILVAAKRGLTQVEGNEIARSHRCDGNTLR
jgi:hypothetical protein